MIEPKTPFEDLILELCKELSDTLILKNREYGNSFKELRDVSKETYQDEKVPYVLHVTEKIKRYAVCGSEDCLLDAAGYSILEIACGRVNR